MALGHTNLHQAPAPWKTLQSAEISIRISKQVGDLRALAMVVCYEGFLSWLELGAPSRAIELLRAHENLIIKSEEAQFQTALKLKLATGYLIQGDRDEEVFAICNETLAKIGDIPVFGVVAHDLIARLHFRRGEYSRAEESARSACKQNNLIPNYQPSSHATLIYSLLKQGKRNSAIEAAQEAQVIIKQFGCLGYSEVEIRLAISELLYATGEYREAKNELTEVLSQIQIRAADISDHYWRNSYLRDNPYCARALQLGREWMLDLGEHA